MKVKRVISENIFMIAIIIKVRLFPSDKIFC